MRRLNPENLINGVNTQFNGETAANAGAKGGRVTGERRRAKKNMREAVQDILDGDYHTKSGEKVTGLQALATNLFRIAMDTKNRNCMQAMKMLLDISGQNLSPLAEKKLMAEIDILQAQVKQMTTGADDANDRLDKILTELRKKADGAESETE